VSERGPYRIAVVGAGPSGLYAVAALLKSQVPVSIDVFDRLPTPYGLVRFGVAPDHAKMKTVIDTLRKPFEVPDVEYFGNVTIEPGFGAQHLREHYHAVVYATGSQRDRDLAIEGEELSTGAVRFVNWYNGHPDAAQADFDLRGEQVAIIGGGNVALDLARVLLKDPDQLGRTDIPDRVLERLRSSSVREVNIFIRRGPAEVKFTPVELGQIGELADVDVFLHNADLPRSAAGSELDRRVKRNLEHFEEWSGREPGGKPRSVHFWFHTRPVEISGSARPEAIVVEQQPATGHSEQDAGRAAGRNPRSIPAQLVIRAIGYDARPVPGLPFDPASGTVPNRDGRVVDRTEIVQGSYVTGWIKRGPTGIIGTNRSCAAETVAAVLADLDSLPAPRLPSRNDLRAALAARAARRTDWQDWLVLDEHERGLGRSRGAERVKIPDLPSILAVLD